MLQLPMPENDSLIRHLRQITRREDKSSLEVIRATRQLLMIFKNGELDPEVICSLNEEVIDFSPENIERTERGMFKFAREEERIIVFPANNIIYLHIDYAVVSGMKIPDDGGKIFIEPEGKRITVEDYSDSLNIPNKNNPERDNTIEIMSRQIPDGYTIIKGK